MFKIEDEVLELQAINVKEEEADTGRKRRCRLNEGGAAAVYDTQLHAEAQTIRGIKHARAMRKELLEDTYMTVSQFQAAAKMKEEVLQAELSIVDSDLKLIGDYKVMNVAEYPAQFENGAGTKWVRDDDEEVVVKRKPANLPVDDGQVVVRHRPASKQPGYKRPSNALVRLKTSNRTEFKLRRLNRIDLCIFDVDMHVLIGRKKAEKNPGIVLEGDKTISREHCKVTAVRDDSNCVILRLDIFGKNGCIIDGQKIKSDTGQVIMVPAGHHRIQFGSIHFDVLVSSKTLKKIKLTEAYAQDGQQEQSSKKKHEAKLEVLDT